MLILIGKGRDPLFKNGITCFTKQSSLDKLEGMFIIGNVWQSCVVHVLMIQFCSNDQFWKLDFDNDHKF